MTAKPLPHFKLKLRDVAKQLYLENGWKLPEGFKDTKLRDPRSFDLEEWQRAKRANLDPANLKEAVQEAWSTSDSPAAFAAALEDRGLFLARGDRRGHVVMDIEGEVFVLSRLVGQKTKAVAAKLGDPERLLSVEATRRKLGGEMNERLRTHIGEARRIAANVMKPLNERKSRMTEAHRAQRGNLSESHEKRAIEEKRARASRIRGGLKGVMDFITGRYFKTRKQNELEAHFSGQRDRGERDSLIRRQLEERRALQIAIKAERDRQARQLIGLHRDASRYRRMRETGVQQDRNRGLELG